VTDAFLDLSPFEVLMKTQPKKTDQELLAECIHIASLVDQVYARCSSITNTPLIWAEEHTPRLAAAYWRDNQALDDLLASRQYSQAELDQSIDKMLASLRVVIKAVVLGKPMPLSEEEHFAVTEKAAIIAADMTTDNYRLAYIRALQVML
jgi:hypothetical protein